MIKKNEDILLTSYDVNHYGYFTAESVKLRIYLVNHKALLRLNKMLYYVLCLSSHSNTEAALFACFSSGWATTTGRRLFKTYFV